jgi:hypothetical protein
MASPVIELIALELLDRLEGLDDYTVVRPDRTGTNITPTDRTIVLRQMPSQPNEQLSCHGNPPAMAFNVVFMCVCSVRNVFGDEPAYDSACNRAASDIIYAVTHPSTNPAGWWTFAGNALNASIGASTPFISSQGERSGVIVPVLITYRVSENDHTQVRP